MTTPSTPDPKSAESATDAGTDVVALQQEVAELKQKLAETSTSGINTAPPKHRLRTIFSVMLIVIGSVLAPIAGLTVFVRNQVLNTDRYVATIAPLSKNPAIASVMATEATTELFKQLNVEATIASYLPPKASGLAGILANQAKTQFYNLTYKVILSDRFNTAWISMNRLVHKSLVGVLTGSGGSAVSADKNGTVSLNLQALLQEVVTNLKSHGLGILSKLPISKLNVQIVLLQSAGLVKAQQVTKWLNDLALLLPLLSLACFAGAIGVSKKRRGALMWSGIGLSISMAVFAVILNLLRSYLISASAGHQLTPEAATALFDTLLRFLRDGIRIVFVVGLLVALGAWLAGPSRPAVGLRRLVGRGYRWLETGIKNRGWDFGEFGQWVAANSGIVQGVVAAIGLLLLVIIMPGIWGVLAIVIIFGLLLVVVRTISLKPKAEGPSSDSDDSQLQLQ